MYDTCSRGRCYSVKACILSTLEFNSERELSAQPEIPAPGPPSTQSQRNAGAEGSFDTRHRANEGPLRLSWLAPTARLKTLGKIRRV
jgi:hypothetical protein